LWELPWHNISPIREDPSKYTKKKEKKKEITTSKDVPAH
jgi:hypothetical protein